MDKEYFDALAQIRLMRSKELLEEAIGLLERDSYKSANSRAFYAMEKGIKALLAVVGVEVTTHNGGLKQFNYCFIYKGDGTFTPEDYQKIASAEQIRNASDYDDFYVASEEDAEEQYIRAKELLEEVQKFLEAYKKH